MFTIPSAVSNITTNPIANRSDLVTLLHDLLLPLLQAQSAGGARICLGHTGTHFDSVAAELEGYSRALWGLAPLLSHDPEAEGFERITSRWVGGLKNGSDPGSDEYWGDCLDRDQRFVEMAGIGYAMCLAPTVFWTPLSPKERDNLNNWLLQANELGFPDNNWRFFRVFINLGLKRVGGRYSQKAIDDEMSFIETFYGPHGLPADGVPHRAYDYYASSFAVPFYSLLYSHLCSEEDPTRAAFFRKCALQNLDLVVNLFAPDGAPIPFGRSMVYRFAVVSVFSAVVYAGIDVSLVITVSASPQLPAPFTLGVLKGLILRTIRYFCSKAEVFNRDGSLSIGYLTSNLFMSEDYNSAQSPYWALKPFLVLALPESHPFWQVEEEPYPSSLCQDAYKVVEPWGQVFTHAGGHTFCLNSGQEAIGPFRHAAAKYAKFAYSSAFGFSVPTGQLGLQQQAPDSMLSISADESGERWFVRHTYQDAAVMANGVLRSSWRPMHDVSITAWLIPPPFVHSSFHTRIFRVENNTSRAVRFADAGFAIHSHSGPPGSERRLRSLNDAFSGHHGRLDAEHSSLALSKAGMSGIVDLLRMGRGVVQDTDGNTNLIAPRSVLPTIQGEISPGTAWLASRAFALPTIDGRVGRPGSDWVKDWQDVEEGKDMQWLKETYEYLIGVAE